MVRYRPATVDDAALASDLMTAAYPPLARDPVVTRWSWERPRRGFVYDRFIAERNNTPIGYVAWSHGPWSEVPDCSGEVEVYLDRAALDVDLLVDIYAWMTERALADGGRVLVSYTGEDEPEAIAALARTGYAAERTEKVWELDLAEHGPRLIEEAHRAAGRADADGIRIIPLAEWKDPDRFKKLHALFSETEQDVPHSYAITPEAFEDFLTRIAAPDRPADRFWIALHGDRPVAVSYLRFPPVRGTVWTGYTATDREYRGRGIARATKLHTLAQAAKLGVPVVATDNDSENEPILRLNERLGYRRRPGFIQHAKRVTSNSHA